MIHDDSLQSTQYILTKLTIDIHFNVIPHVHLKSFNLVSKWYILFCSPYIELSQWDTLSHFTELISHYLHQNNFLHTKHNF